MAAAPLGVLGGYKGKLGGGGRQGGGAGLRTWRCGEKGAGSLGEIPGPVEGNQGVRIRSTEGCVHRVKCFL